MSPTSQELIRVLSCATSDVSDSNKDPPRATECHDLPSAEPKVVRDSGVFHRHVPLINTGLFKKLI